MLPRDLPLAPRARMIDVLTRRARIVGARTAVARDDLGLAPGVVSPYEAREAMGLRYGDPAIEEARYDRTRTPSSDIAVLARWLFAQAVDLTSRTKADVEARPYVVSTRIDPLDTGEAVAKILSWLQAGRGGRVFFVHPHALNLASRDEVFRAELARGDLVLPDGIGLRVASSMLGLSLPANVNGTDLVPELLLELAADRIPIALVGGARGVAEKAAAAWSRTGVSILGTWDGFGDDDSYRAMTASLEAAGRCVVLVAMGSPQQERFSLRHLEALPKAVTITVGGLFDFASGEKKRAPLAWRELGLEWAWRLVHEPRRLGRRYLIGNPEFLLRAGAQRLRARR